MVLSEYTKIRILLLWREGDGPTAIVKRLDQEGIKTKENLCHCSFQGMFMYVISIAT